MKTVNIEYRNKEEAFATEAAKHFRNNKAHTTYSSGEIMPGEFLGLRWGLDADSVVVLKLDDEADVNLYPNIVGIPNKKRRNFSDLTPEKAERLYTLFMEMLTQHVSKDSYAEIWNKGIMEFAEEAKAYCSWRS